MAGGGGGRNLEETPTWAVAVVCFILVSISIVIEFGIHLIGKWLKNHNKRALYEALEKIKSELMLLGFISLLLTVGQGPISDICISKEVADTWHPCDKQEESDYYKNDDYGDSGGDDRRKLLAFLDPSWSKRRVLAGAGYDKCAEKAWPYNPSINLFQSKSPYLDISLDGQVPFVSADGIHQLHIFIFILAVFHVLYCILTLALGRLKMRKWKAWEMETKTTEYQFTHDPERFRFARETSFGRRHLNAWSKSPVLLWIMCFFRQFITSVAKVDYFTLRHGFIIAHLAPQSQHNFDFQKYINRSLEEDFKVVVGISPTIWLFAVLFLLFNTHGWRSYLYLPFIPLVIILLVSTKLQVIITKMGLRIQERGEVVKGTPVVKPGDDLFWFNRPRLILYFIHFVLFQNAFQLAFFAWTWYEFSLKSCFHEKTEDVVIRISMGVIIQILCSYVTLPLYALVTQMGSTMKPTIFNERVAKALRNWHQSAKKHIKQSKHSGVATPSSSHPSTPLHGMSPIHLLRHYKDEVDSFHNSPRKSNLDNEFNSPRKSNLDNEFWNAEGSVSPSHRPHDDVPWSHHDSLEQEREGHLQPGTSETPSAPQNIKTQHEIEMGSTEFSFEKRS
ncbi:Mlo-related protein [Dillenia turbinata]|uniref:MLO-like protein n=1 Tax=Dillenia turbinata TaxID=194707 RepID=A0AAN8VXR9_9MAGN